MGLMAEYVNVMFGVLDRLPAVCTPHFWCSVQLDHLGVGVLHNLEQEFDSIRESAHNVRQQTNASWTYCGFTRTQGYQANTEELQKELV